MIFYTSDTHFGHANIIKYSKRPFASVDEMNEAMVRNWNERVRPDDDVWHLGDFAMGSKEAIPGILDRLMGRKHLIWGNHDSEQTRQLPGWTSSQPYAEIVDSGQKIVLLHYGMRVWNGSHKGVLQFYGHSHGSLPGDSQSQDVGVDCFDYRPVILAEIKDRLRLNPVRGTVDHHGV